jgi:limonene-1,2-epoxide hydrolase
VKTISLKKRIALVAVAALGTSLVASVPANAATAAVVSVVNATLATSAPSVGAEVQVNVGLTTTAAGSNSMILKAGFIGGTDTPTGGWVSVAAATAIGNGSAGTFGTTGITSSSASGATLTLVSAASTLAGTIASSATAGAGSFSFTPTKAGTYILSIWHEADNGGTADAINSNEARQTVSITVAAAATASGGTSRMVVKSGAVSGATAGGTRADDDLSIIGDRTVGTQRAIATVQVRNSSGDVMNGATVAATISGPGLVLVNTTQTTLAGTARSSSSGALTGASVAYVHVSGDGTSGKGTVTVTVTDPVTAVSTTVGTFDVTFYSTTVATLTATANYVNVGASVTHGCSSVTCLGTTYSTGSAGKAAVVLVAKDSSGMVIPGRTITNTITDATVVGSTTVTEANASDLNGLGYYNVSVTGASNATSGKTTTVTWSIVNSATSTITSNAITFTVGGTTIAKETLTLDKTSYTAGDPMVVTRTATDAAGNPVADGTASPAVTFSKTVGGTAPAASTYVAGKSATSATAPSVFAPVTGGAFTASMTGGDTAKTVVTASSSVIDGNAALLTQIDALNAKIVALNALIAKIMKKLGVK